MKPEALKEIKLINKKITTDRQKNIYDTKRVYSEQQKMV